jgi:endopolyphosphatase
MSIVSPSVVPNFFPTLRVIEYNISGLEDHSPATRALGVPAPVEQAEEPQNLPTALLSDQTCRSLEDDHDLDYDVTQKKRKRKRRKGKKRRRRPDFPVPKPPSPTAPPGPGYSPQTLSLLSWTQYYANLTKIQADILRDTRNDKDHHRHFKYQVEYMTHNDSAYRLKDLTVRSWLDVAERIAREKLAKEEEEMEGDEERDEDGGEEEGPDEDYRAQNQKKIKKLKNHLWKTFVKRAFVHTKLDDEIDQDF